MIKRGLFLVLLTLCTSQWEHPYNNDWFQCLEKFDGFMNKFEKNYDVKAKEYKIKTFYENYIALKKISKPLDYKVGINYFSDVSWEEFQRDYLMHINIPQELEDFKIENPKSFHSITELPEFQKKDLQKNIQKNLFSKDFWGDHKKEKCSCHRFLQDYSWNPHYNTSNYQSYNHNQSYPLNNRYHYNRTHTPYRRSPSRSYGYSPTTNSYLPGPRHTRNRYSHTNHSNYNNHRNHYNNSQNRYTPNNYSHGHSRQNKRQRHQYRKKRNRMDPMIRNFPQRKTWEHNATPVKNQQKCAACYAFAALAAVELQVQRTGQFCPALSEQEIIDCSGNNGCVGGSPFKVFNFINRNRGVSYLSDYPYVGRKNHKCMSRQLGNRRRFTKRLNYFFVGNPVELIVALNKGPVVIIQHVNRNFKRYTGGVFDDRTCRGKLNHAALAVGYDLSGPIPYIKCKNEWGSGWGMGGYYKIALGDITRSSKGICGMFTHGGNVVPTLGY